MRTLIAIGILTGLTHSPSSAQQPVGVLNLTLSTNPGGKQSEILVTGPNGYSRRLSGSEKLVNLADGQYSFSGEITIQREPSISKAFRPTPITVTVKRDTQNVNIGYKLMPGSDKLWLGNQNAPAGKSLHIVAFSDQQLGTSSAQSEPVTKLTGKATSIKSLAFDADGNLWTADAGTIKMYPWHKLGDTNVTASITLMHEASCLAFDPAGNLWFADGKTASKVMRIQKTGLNQSGSNKVDITLSGTSFKGTQGLAFDAAGNLWAANYGKNDVVKIPTNLLGTPSTALNDLLSVTCMSKPPVINTLSAPKGMAFDLQGNLWVGYFGPNVIAQIPASQLQQSGKITPEIQFTLNVSVLLHQLAFDEDGALWTVLSTGKFGKISPQQLTTSGKKSPDVIITSSELNYGSGIAIYPHPQGYPIQPTVR
ncbi:MAG: hypothetical protein KF725_12755 [Cyclobacteriaceae bacterium]|nr:hypothetical protein [Cyclobacteriaceae bacterium]UYN85500.1 MAG: hypothetical protein KIT51_11460 [Cyclobacteriaceae bacterium]